MDSIGVLRPQVRGGDSSSGSSERRPHAHRIPINIPATTFSSNGAESILLLLLLQSKTSSGKSQAAQQLLCVTVYSVTVHFRFVVCNAKRFTAAQGLGGSGLQNSALAIPGIEIPPPPQEFSLEIGNPKVQEPTKFLMQDAPRAAPEKIYPVTGIG
ncbi:hypothetical protein RvY_04455-1 [Ramazzottius varieornatus]|uniref:Uncharacterized protein n=1 Tax=Ramazzottius varieornatus TaxID=947166 RepID=A0A1D1URN6_RAMVA|nr:hypothetical protein RvY_04455-1 [Ramazzottius varieornatus]